jgi:hypothetical protein
LHIQKHPKAKPFKKKSFPLYDELAELIDGTRATGASVFRVGSPSLARARLSSSSIDAAFEATEPKSSDEDTSPVNILFVFVIKLA